MTASTCSALTRPSPVVVLSRHSRCPEVSPPSTPAVLAQQLQHVAVADLGAQELDALARAARARGPRLLITVPTTGPLQLALRVPVAAR